MYTEFQWHRCLIYNLVFQVVDPTYTVGTEETCIQIKHINLVGATERTHMSCLASYVDSGASLPIEEPAAALLMNLRDY